MTGFEIGSIIIGCLTALGTVGATVVAIRIAFLNSKNRFKIKNCEHKNFTDQELTDSDIIFTNLGRTNSQVEHIGYYCGNKTKLVKELYGDNCKVQLFYKVAPLETIRIRSVFDAVSKSIIPRDDFLDKNFDYKRFYSYRHIKFTLKNSHGDQYKKNSKYSIKHYLKVYEENNIVSPWQIYHVERYVAETDKPCIYCAISREDFRVFEIQDLSKLTEIISKIEELCYREANYRMTMSLTLVTTEKIRYFTFSFESNLNEALHFIKDKSVKRSVADIANMHSSMDLINAMYDNSPITKIEIIKKPINTTTKK